MFWDSLWEGGEEEHRVDALARLGVVADSEDSEGNVSEE